MESKTFFSNKKDSKQAAHDILEQIRSHLDFKPDLTLFYATLKYNGRYQSMLDKFYEELGDVPQIGASVDGMIFPNDIRMDGAALVLCKDPGAKITAQCAKEKGSLESARKLAGKIKCENGVVILHFPLVHVPSAFSSAQFFAKGFYYSNRCKKSNHDKQKEYAGKFADYCDRENIFYIPPTILDIFAQQTNFKVPIIGINVLHAQARFNSPNIFCNFKDIEDGIAALTIEKKNINAIYDDIFPNKGRTLEETKQVAREEFTIIKEFKANFEKNILISLDGIPPVQAVKNLIYVSERKKDELYTNLHKGDYKVHSPYGLLFFNKKTNGVLLLGIGSYVPFDLFPFFVDVSDYSEDVALAYELVDEKFDLFISSLKNLKNNNDSFVFFCVDAGVTTAFGEKVFDYKDKINKLVAKNYFGILSTTSSAYIPPEFQLRNYLSESFSNTFFMAGGTSSCLEI
jgi:hypothetical protein